MTNSHFDYNPSYCSTGLSSWILTNSWPCLELQTDGKVVTNTCLATQPRKKTWRQLSPMPYKLFNALHSGDVVTPSQAEKRFGIKNISAEVSRIRQAGFAVYANKRVAGNGVKVTEYVLGKPSRKIVAAGYKALAMGLV